MMGLSGLPGLPYVEISSHRYQSGMRFNAFTMSVWRDQGF
jgi:hypothetical protein